MIRSAAANLAVPVRNVAFYSKSIGRFVPTLLAGLALTLSGAEPIKVKVVVVAMFERGEDTGDAPGEFQHWVEREKLDKVLPFPAGLRNLRMSADESVLGVVAGTWTTDSGSTIMALGLDPRFDLSKAYWIVGGIAGVDPEDASIGSAAWPNFVLNGDRIYEIDPREAPADWPYGRMSAMSAKKPNELPQPPPSDLSRWVTELNPKLVEWAYQLTKNVKLMDTPEMAAYRATYKGYPNAMKPPFVLKGDDLGNSIYWHGKILNQWANDLMKLWTNGRGNFVMTNNEDHAIATTLTRLAELQRVDFQRVLFLRTGSNYSMQAPGGQSAQESMAGHYATEASVDALQRVGSVVLHEVLKNWKTFQDKTPAQ